MKNIVIPQFCYIKVGYKGVYIIWTCYRDVNFTCEMFGLTGRHEPSGHMTSDRRRCHVMTSHRRRSDVILTSCACWEAKSWAYHWLHQYKNIGCFNWHISSDSSIKTLAVLIGTSVVTSV